MKPLEALNPILIGK